MRLLITGATGLIGTHISDLCKEKGIQVNYLTRSKKKIEKIPHYQGFHWDPRNKEIDERCFEDVDAIIHLAGATIAKRWTSSYKKKIIDSRVNTAALLYNSLRDSNFSIPHFVSASGVNVYPDSRQKLYFEDTQELDNSFIGRVVQKWEAAADDFRDLGMKVTKIRTGLVLAKEDGALPKLKAPVKLNVGSALGSGKQWQSWIHVDDLARIYLHVVEHELDGVYNGVAPNPVTNKELMDKVASQMGKSIWLPNVPAVVLKSTLGEMATVVLSSQLVSSKKIQETGFEFQFQNISKALEDLIE